jgi:hypothetical protein
MTGWDLAPGVWKVTQAVDPAGGATNSGGANVALEVAGEPRHVEFERTKGIDFTFAPHATTVLDLELETAGKPVWERPDVGIGTADVRVSKGTIRVVVHSLGSVPAPPSTVTLVDASGRDITTAQVPAIPAPLDLLPKTAQATLWSGRASVGREGSRPVA